MILKQAKAKLKAYHKAYYQRPEVKADRKAYHKAYYQRPEVIANRKAYFQRPEVIAHYKEYMTEYNKTYDQKRKKLLPESKWKKTPFYKQYGMTMTEMGRLQGVSKETIRKRFNKLKEEA